MGLLSVYHPVGTFSQTHASRQRPSGPEIIPAYRQHGVEAVRLLISCRCELAKVLARGCHQRLGVAVQRFQSIDRMQELNGIFVSQ